jgi:DNA-binding response OmpR family regulator
MSQKKHNILIIEDDVEYQDKLVHIFRSEPYEFSRASTVPEAKEYLRDG